MTRRVRWMALAAIAAGLAGCGGDAADRAADTPEETATEATPPAAAPEESPTEAAEAAPAAAPESTGGTVNILMNPQDPQLNREAPQTFRVRLTTSKGPVVLELHRDWSPRGVDRFYNLVEAGFYDGVRFFRVLDGFMAQFGINGDPRIQARWANANIQDEPVVEGNTRGRITYAKSARPNSRSTQLFINFEDNSPLDAQGFAAIGEVVEGMDVVDRLYSGYGEGPPRGAGPNQGLIQQRGNEYLNSDFPDLDYIEKAEVIG
jgi:peptidyl-prolyl cis-trans isomerase A (cyclophilin A)